MLTIHAAGSATVPPIVSCSFVFRVVGFIIDDSKKKKPVSLKKEMTLLFEVGNSSPKIDVICWSVILAAKSLI